MWHQRGKTHSQHTYTCCHHPQLLSWLAETDLNSQQLLEGMGTYSHYCPFSIPVVGGNSCGCCLLRAPGPTAAHTDPFICLAHPSQFYASSPLVLSACREILFPSTHPAENFLARKCCPLHWYSVGGKKVRDPGTEERQQQLAENRSYSFK